MGELYDAPNQQAVGQPPPWVEGAGGSTSEAAPAAQQSEDLSALTKAELLDRARAQGVEADESMTKAQIIQAIEA